MLSIAVKRHATPAPHQRIQTHESKISSVRSLERLRTVPAARLNGPDLAFPTRLRMRRAARDLQLCERIDRTRALDVGVASVALIDVVVPSPSRHAKRNRLA